MTLTFMLVGGDVEFQRQAEVLPWEGESIIDGGHFFAARQFDRIAKVDGA
ncbi:hypothetical protein [Embleya sp. NPDC005971]